MKKQFPVKRKLKVFLIVIIACLALGGAVMFLWNAILPDVIGVKTITFIQALGILLLSKILFGGFRGGCGEHKRGRWMQMQQKMAAMTPEEREKFKSEWRNRCSGKWGTTGNAQNISQEEK